MVILRVHRFIQALIFIVFHSVWIVVKIQILWRSVYIVAEIITRKRRKKGESKLSKALITRYMLYVTVKQYIVIRDPPQTTLCSILEGRIREVGALYAMNSTLMIYTLQSMKTVTFFVKLVLFDNTVLSTADYCAYRSFRSQFKSDQPSK